MIKYLFLTLPLILFSSNVTEEQVKVVYTYNFMKNIEWKEDFQSYKLLVISTNGELKDLFSLLSSKKRLDGKKIEVFFDTSIEESKNYQVIYLDSEFKFMNSELISKLDKGQLLISNGVEDKNSIMINLLSSQQKVNFEINRANILNRDLEISSDMVLLGGREIDIATIYRDIQKNFNQKLSKIEELNSVLEEQELQKKSLERHIETHRKELKDQEALIRDTTKKLNLKQSELRKKEVEFKKYEDEMLKKSLQLNKLFKRIKESENELLAQQKLLDINREKYQKSLKEIEDKQEDLKKLNGFIERQKEIVASQVEEIDQKNRKISNLEIVIFTIFSLITIILFGYRKILRDKKIIEKQFSELEILHRDINNSIKYASYIQNAIVPTREKLNRLFKSSFYLWKPRDGVGGDIFFLEEFDSGKSLLIVVDCTSHGVPGALVTMLVKAVEKQLMTEIRYGRINLSSPSEILRYFNGEIKSLLNQYDKDKSSSNVGFDGGVLYIDRERGEVKFSGAETPLYYIEDNEVKITKYDRQSIGYPDSKDDYKFKEYTFQIENVNRFYISTDGYYDQVGGEKRVMFGKKRLLRTIKSFMSTPFQQQGIFLYKALEEYQGYEIRRDDITLIGVEI